MKTFTLNREEKLKGHKLVKELFTRPLIKVDFPYKVFYKWDVDGLNKGLKLGVSVAKRKFKKSPDRNRIKRIIKEAYRLEKAELKEDLDRCLSILPFMLKLAKVKNLAPLFN